MTLKHPAETNGGQRSRFDHLAEQASNFTSSAAFFRCCLILVLGVLAVHATGLSTDTKLLAGDAMTAVTLLLLALLKNSERRSERAVQRKLDAIAASLLELHGSRQGSASEGLEAAIRMEEEL
ncbi:low affinity iron permease family protein [Streptacidiphilus sp. PAMC 29251]